MQSPDPFVFACKNKEITLANSWAKPYGQNRSFVIFLANHESQS